jgi:hypothetical protein
MRYSERRHHALVPSAAPSGRVVRRTRLMAVSKRTIERWAKSLTSWEHGLARLGECVAHFQRIDEAPNICISALIGRGRKIGEIVTSEMSFRAKIAVYPALCHHALGVEKLPQELRELVARLHWAEQERNTIVVLSREEVTRLMEPALNRRRSYPRWVLPHAAQSAGSWKPPF